LLAFLFSHSFRQDDVVRRSLFVGIRRNLRRRQQFESSAEATTFSGSVPILVAVVEMVETLQKFLILNSIIVSFCRQQIVDGRKSFPKRNFLFSLQSAGRKRRRLDLKVEFLQINKCFIFKTITICTYGNLTKLFILRSKFQLKRCFTRLLLSRMSVSMIAIDFLNLEVLFQRGCRERVEGATEAVSSSSWLVWKDNIKRNFILDRKL
jgi:hypothetical protein